MGRDSKWKQFREGRPRHSSEFPLPKEKERMENANTSAKEREREREGGREGEKNKMDSCKDS